MPFITAWDILISELDDLPDGATLITLLSHKRFRITDVQDSRVVIQFDNKDEHRPLQRDQFETLYHRIQDAEDIDRGEPFFDLSERAVRNVVKRTAERAAQETGDEDFQYVSSHDLRRRYAQRLLVDERVNPRVVMQVGGWSSFQAIEPYLNAPTPEVVNEAFEQTNLG